MNKKILKEVNKYYSDKVIEHGASSQGVDWNGKESHFLRFEQLCKVLDKENKFTLLDYGCGFGSLIEYLDECKFQYDYFGFDISLEMIKKANSIYSSENISFNSVLDKSGFDYTVANGIFNVKLDSSEEEWIKYIEETLIKMNDVSQKGFSFNILTSYSDDEYKKDYLYYADPLYFFDFCKKNFSRNIALLHDYDLYEFTIIVKKIILWRK
jgi:SAM-dependent methyltransferase